TLMTTQFAQKKSFNTTFQEPNPKWEDLQKSAKQRNLQYADLQYKSSVDSVSASPSPARPDQFWSQLQVLGQAQQTYIITQKEDRMVIVDQHAAHERVVFEKLMQAWNLQNQNHSSPQQNPWPIQDYLFPLAIDLSIEQSEALLKMQNDLEKLGVFIEALGPSTIGVKAAPSFIKEAALSQTLTVMAQEVVDQGGSYKLENTIADVFASLACHSAVRAGQALSLEQMKALLVEMDEFPLSSFCPHGRPVSVEYSFIEMEKDFGRRV
ncbi:MAG: DNA mismatch repair protein MutL, partial [Pseudobdellovibrionaceae bacterium]